MITYYILSTESEITLDNSDYLDDIF